MRAPNTFSPAVLDSGNSSGVFSRENERSSVSASFTQSTARLFHRGSARSSRPKRLVIRLRFETAPPEPAYRPYPLMRLSSRARSASLTGTGGWAPAGWPMKGPTIGASSR